eukprot:Lankesteria_metandrocarpae@DN4546_c0_g1_i1.p1
MRHYIVNCLLLGIISLNTDHGNGHPLYPDQFPDLVQQPPAEPYQDRQEACAVPTMVVSGSAAATICTPAKWNVTASKKGKYDLEFLKAMAHSLTDLAQNKKELKNLLRNELYIYIDLKNKQTVRLTTNAWRLVRSSPIKIRPTGVAKWRAAVAYGVDDVTVNYEIIDSWARLPDPRSGILVSITDGCDNWNEARIDSLTLLGRRGPHFLFRFKRKAKETFVKTRCPFAKKPSFFTKKCGYMMDTKTKAAAKTDARHLVWD